MDGLGTRQLAPAFSLAVPAAFSSGFAVHAAPAATNSSARVHHGVNPEIGHELMLHMVELVSENGVDPEVDTGSTVSFYR